jgi:hypothetical protein
LTTNDDILTRAAGVPARITRANLAADAAFTGAFWPNSTTALTGANLANGDKLAVVDVGSPDVPKYITADELAQGSQFSSRFVPKSGDVLGVSAGAMAPAIGSPTLSGGGGSRFGYWLLDASTAESLGGSIVIPPWWSTCHVDMLYNHWTDGGTGDIYMDFHYLSATNDDSAFSGWAGPLFTTHTVTTWRLMRYVRLATSITVGGGEMLMFGVRRVATDAADTFASDIQVAGLVFTRAS